MKKREKICIHQNSDGKLYLPEDRINIQNEYKPAIDAVTNFFRKLNNKNIHSIYLRGSIVFGLGIKNSSDIDFFVITVKPLTDFDKSIIKKNMNKINREYSFITKFDFGYFNLDKILSMKENVLLKLSSICILGDDIKPKIKDPSPGKEITISLSLLEGEVEKTKQEIEAGIYDKTNTKDMCVWIMKRIVRSGLEIVSEREKCFTRDLGLCFELFSKHYPDKKEFMKKALTLALTPTNNTVEIKKIFDSLANWLVKEGKHLKLIPPTYKNIDSIVSEKVLSMFKKERITSLLRYGPKSKFDGSPPSDFDFLLLLNKYNYDDYTKLASIKSLNLPIEIFIDYKDEILNKGIINYQRGRHGSYFFKILAYADVLIGDNFYKKYEYKLDKNKINLDLLYRIEEYFYRIQKSIVNGNPQKEDIEKYIGRILTDLLLVNGSIDFKDMHTHHYTTIIGEIANSTNIVDKNTKNMLSKFKSEAILNQELLGKIIGILYKQYLKIRKNYT